MIKVERKEAIDEKSYQEFISQKKNPEELFQEIKSKNNYLLFFWMYDQTGILQRLIHKFVEKQNLTLLEIRLVVEYIICYMENISRGSGYPDQSTIENLKKDFRKINQMKKIWSLITERLLEFGIDPL